MKCIAMRGYNILKFLQWWWLCRITSFILFISWVWKFCRYWFLFIFSLFHRIIFQILKCMRILHQLHHRRRPVILDRDTVDVAWSCNVSVDDLVVSVIGKYEKKKYYILYYQWRLMLRDTRTEAILEFSVLTLTALIENDHFPRWMSSARTAVSQMCWSCESPSYSEPSEPTLNCLGRKKGWSELRLMKS